MEIGKIGNILSINRKVLSHPEVYSLSHCFMHRSVLEKKCFINSNPNTNV